MLLKIYDFAKLVLNVLYRASYGYQIAMDFHKFNTIFCTHI